MKYLIIILLFVGCGFESVRGENGKCYTGNSKYNRYGSLVFDDDGYSVQYNRGENALYGTPNRYFNETEIKCPSSFGIHPLDIKHYKNLGIYKQIKKAARIK